MSSTTDLKFLSSFLAKTGQFLVKSYTSGITGNNFALLVAGYTKEDTQAASTYVQTQEFDTSTVDYTGPVISI